MALVPIVAGLGLAELVQYGGIAKQLWEEYGEVGKQVARMLYKKATKKGMPFDQFVQQHGQRHIDKIQKHHNPPTPAKTPGKHQASEQLGGDAKRRLFVSDKKQTGISGMPVSRKRRTKRRSTTVKKADMGKVGKKKSYSKSKRPVKRVKKTKSLGWSRFLKTGSVERVEKGGVWDDTQCLYIGHSIGIEYLITSMWRAFYGFIMARHGTPVSVWSDKLNQKLALDVEYRFESTLGTNAVVRFDFDANSTHNTLALYIRDRVRIKFGAGYPANFWSWRLGGRSAGAQTDPAIDPTSTHNQDLPMSYGWFEEMSVEFNHNSKMRIQNQTLAGPKKTGFEQEVPAAGTLVGDGEQVLIGHRENMFNILSNPIRGLHYTRMNPRNGFMERSRPTRTGTTGQVQPAANFIAGSVSGILANKAAFMNPLFNKPPKGSSFDGKIKTTPVQIVPGAWVSDFINWNKTFKFNTFVMKYAEIINQVPLGNQIVALGKAAMYALEKKIDSRTGANEVAIQWELNATYACRMWATKRHRTEPLLDVQTTASTVFGATAPP